MERVPYWLRAGARMVADLKVCMSETMLVCVFGKKTAPQLEVRWGRGREPVFNDSGFALLPTRNFEYLGYSWSGARRERGKIKESDFALLTTRSPEYLAYFIEGRFSGRDTFRDSRDG